MKNGKVIDEDGTIYYYKDGKYHREDGPAFIDPDGTKAWYVNDKLHRVDGPAIIYPNGNKSWWINGKHYTKENFFNKLTISQKLTFLYKPENF